MPIKSGRDETYLHALAREMARPVAMGWLPASGAYAALTLAADREAQRSSPYDLAPTLHSAWRAMQRAMIRRGCE